MLDIQQIESELKQAIKARDQLKADVLRGLKTRITNEQIAKLSARGGSPAKGGASGGRELSKEELAALVRSEIKRRKEAAESFKAGGRQELADKELREAEILEKYLPPQMGEAELINLVETVIAENQFTAKDFGKAMGALKAKVGPTAEGATLVKLLKEKLK